MYDINYFRCYGWNGEINNFKDRKQYAASMKVTFNSRGTGWHRRGLTASCYEHMDYAVAVASRLDKKPCLLISGGLSSIVLLKLLVETTKHFTCMVLVYKNEAGEVLNVEDVDQAKAAVASVGGVELIEHTISLGAFLSTRFALLGDLYKTRNKIALLNIEVATARPDLYLIGGWGIPDAASQNRIVYDDSEIVYLMAAQKDVHGCFSFFNSSPQLLLDWLTDADFEHYVNNLASFTNLVRREVKSMNVNHVKNWVLHRHFDITPVVGRHGFENSAIWLYEPFIKTGVDALLTNYKYDAVKCAIAGVYERNKRQDHHVDVSMALSYLTKATND